MKNRLEKHIWCETFEPIHESGSTSQPSRVLFKDTSDHGRNVPIQRFELYSSILSCKIRYKKGLGPDQLPVGVIPEEWSSSTLVAVQKM